LLLLESLKENIELLYKQTNGKYQKLITDYKFLGDLIYDEKKKIGYNNPKYNFYQSMEIDIINYLEKLKNFPDVEFQHFGIILKNLDLIKINKKEEIVEIEKQLMEIKFKLQEKEKIIISMENESNNLDLLTMQKSMALEKLNSKIANNYKLNYFLKKKKI